MKMVLNKGNIVLKMHPEDGVIMTLLIANIFSPCQEGFSTRQTYGNKRLPDLVKTFLFKLAELP